MSTINELRDASRHNTPVILSINDIRQIIEEFDKLEMENGDAIPERGLPIDVA